MISVLWFSVNAVVPILLVLGLGYFLSRRGFLSKEFLQKGNAVVFKILLPMTIFHNVYEVESLASINWSLVLFCLTVILLLFGIGCLAAHCLVKESSAKGVFIQCVFRSNFAIIGLPLAESLGGAAGAAMAAVLSAFTIPLFNVLAVIVLTVYAGESKKQSVGKIMIDIIKNPLILAAAAGLLCLGVRSLLPVDTAGIPVFTLQNQLPFVYKAITWLHQSSSPLALVIMGGMLDFGQVRGKWKNIVLGTVFRIGAAPIVGLGATFLCTYWGLLSCGPGEYGALIALFGSPVAVSSAIMASSIGGDDELARQYVVWTAIGSMFSLFALTALLRGWGIL